VLSVMIPVRFVSSEFGLCEMPLPFRRCTYMEFQKVDEFMQGLKMKNFIKTNSRDLELGLHRICNYRENYILDIKRVFRFFSYLLF
jgi:hypothetical protein